MQNLKFPLTALIAILFLSLSSCKKDDADNEKENYTVTVSNVVNRLVENDWKVLSFIDGDEGEDGAKFAGYRFTFKSDNQVTATKVQVLHPDNGDAHREGNWLL